VSKKQENLDEDTPTLTDKDSDPKPGKSSRWVKLVLPLVLVSLGTAAFLFLPGWYEGRQTDDLSYSEVFADITDYKDFDATITPKGSVKLTPPESTDAKTVVTRIAPDAVESTVIDLDAAGLDVKISPDPTPNPFLNLLGAMLPVFLIIGFLVYFLSKKGGMGGASLGLSKKKSAPVDVPDTDFSKVAGADEAAHDLFEIVEFLRSPERFTAAGARMPHGYLLVGPPGTGKTLLARAVAGEASVPFFSIAGSDLVEMYVGLGASRVRDLFANARKAGSAVIFIDEIDAIGRSRGASSSGVTNDEREQTLNALLVEMDGFAKDTSIVVLAATNRAEVLDKALLRPGRFDRTIGVSAPDRAGRSKLLDLYSAGKVFSDDVDFISVARRTPGMTGADIEQLLNEAALESARNGRTTITAGDMESSLQTTILGRQRKSAVLTDFDRNVTAWHEAGHATAALLTPDAHAPVSVSIIPRGASGGATWMEGSDDVYQTRSNSLASLLVSFAGRAAEEIYLDGDYTHGAHGDLGYATSLATTMVSKLGMGKTLRSIPDEALHMPTADNVGYQVEELLTTALDQARLTLASNRPLLEAVVGELLVKETLNAADLERLAAQF